MNMRRFVLIVLFLTYPQAVSQPRLTQSEPILIYSERTYGIDYVNTANTDIYLLIPETKQWVNLTNNSGEDLFPVISPDGEKVAFLSDWKSRGDATFRLYYLELSNPETVYDLTSEQSLYPSNVSWAPDSRSIVYTAYNDNSDLELRILHLEKLLEVVKVLNGLQ